MRHLHLFAFLLSMTAALAANIVDNGQAKAEIVIAPEPTRLVSLAAADLQTYIRKISGAELPIVSEPGEMPVKLYVGSSPAVEALGISIEGLAHGGFRLVSGPDYLVMLGPDYDFEPKGPWARNHGDRPRAQEDFDKLVDGKWMTPMNSLFRKRHRDLDIWAHDQSGSYNAVCEFLRRQGVRWYMPGELGEVVPQAATIALPEVDERVMPDSAVRFWFGAYFAYEPEVVMWDLRLGMNSGYEVLGAGMHVHGMRLIQSRDEMQEAHPEYYALHGGQRDTEFRGSGHACFTSEGLKQEAVNFARAIFDLYDEPAVSLWPQDGFRQCQCEDCWAMTASDNVWTFINDVAKELYKTHPDRKVTGGAYGGYRAPPASIDRFSPNVYVFISHGRAQLTEESEWEAHKALVDGWVEKVGPGRILTNSNDLPPMVLHPTAFARDLTYTKGLSIGDWNEVRRGTVRPGTVNWRTPGLDHLNLYVNARLLWDRDLDLQSMLDEYYPAFYGSAAEAMRAAHTYAEANYQRIGRGKFPLQNQIEYRQLLEAALAKANGIHAERIQLILSEMKPLDQLRQDLQAELEARQRPDARLAIGRDAGSAEEPPSYELVEIIEGGEPEIGTRFHVVWDEDALVFTITCDDPDMENLYVSKDIWGGDSVAILLETPNHSYYQIELNPDGDHFDADRKDGKIQDNWSSHLTAETERGDDFWRVKVRIPVVGESEGALDPLNFVVGPKPSAENPWHFQLGRVRISDNQKSAWTFMSTGSNYHNLKRFGRLEIQ